MIVSLQGSQLSPGQRRNLALQQQVKGAFLNPVLAESVEATLKAMEVRKEQGVKPERIWFKDSEVFGTVSVAEWMGY